MTIYDIAKLRVIAQGLDQEKRFLISKAADALENQQNEIKALKQICEKQSEMNGKIADMALELDTVKAERDSLRHCLEYMNQPDERREIYRAALHKWGAEAQSMKAIEEMSELTKEICKLGFRQGDLECLADEIADVTIMMEQLRLIYNINDKVCEHMDYKLTRLKSKIGMDGSAR